MSKYNKETLQKLEKSKLIRLLEKEGIEASIHQPKTELIRFLLLAKRANSPTTSGTLLNEVPEKSRKKIFGIAIAVLIILSSVLLYFFNSTFQKNINFIGQKVFGQEEQASTDFGPTIYERNGKTYVVYDYPLINVKAVHDSSCKRPECSLDTFFNQIKSYISPLVAFDEIEYDSREGKNLIEEYNLNLLPVFIFDINIEKTENFENSKRNLEKVKDKYVLQVPPSNLINGPQLDNARIYSKATDAEKSLTVVEYTGFSCKLCLDASNAVKGLSTKFEGKITRYVKYFNTGEKDLPASIAAECAGQQDKFKEYYDILFSRQDDWINLGLGALNGKFTGYATELGLAKTDFSACLVNENVKQIVLAHFNEAGSLGISAAPTIVVNNNVLVGSYPEESLIKTVQDIITSN